MSVSTFTRLLVVPKIKIPVEDAKEHGLFSRKGGELFGFFMILNKNLYFITQIYKPKSEPKTSHYP